MSENSPERGAPPTPEERAEQIRIAKERAAAARVARASDAGAPAAAPASANTPVTVEQPAATAPAERAERAPVSAADRSEQIRVAKERAEAARVARASGATPAVARPSATEAPAAAAAAPTAAPRAERAAPLSPEERIAAVEAAKQRAAAARAARGTDEPAPAAQPAAARAAASPEDRAAAVAQAQERAAAIRAQRAAPVPAAVTATAEPVPTWRLGPNGSRVQVLSARPEAHAREMAAMDAPSRVVIRRRDLLRGGFWAGLAVLTVGGLSTFLDFFNPRDIRGFGGIVTIPSQSIPKPGEDPFHFLEGKTWLINLKPGEGVPEQFHSVAPPSEKGGILALYHKCVHLGCTVPWRADFEFGGVTGWFRCPCHGSTYTKGGVRVFGPAPRSLDSFLVTKVDANGVSVNTGKITLGGTNDPQRAVPAGPFA